MVMTQQSDYRNSSILDELKERVCFFPPPPEGFDPLTADPEVRVNYGIPPQPDPDQHPMLTRFWTEMYSPPLVFAPRFLLGFLPTRISAELLVTTTARREASLNWSGAYITPRDGQQLTEVHATWEIPLVAAPAGMPGSAEYRSSIWIGLDGQRRYFDSSLPQFGTGQFVNAPAPAQPFHTWCQWWLRNNPQTYIPAILSVGVAPGQRVMASLRVVNETRVHCIIKNRTTGVILPFTMDAPTDKVSGIQVKISGATAEWVVERPAEEHTGEPYELPNYNTVPFTNCFALSAKMPVGGVPGPGRERTLDGARLIRMYKIERNPSRTVVISKAERPDVDQFKTLYVN
jgi:hypothetical protein